MVEANCPNVLFLLSDQHNPEVMGCYGDPVVETPSLDALAERGALFENAYCTSPLCAPSRMSLLTGRHPYEVGVLRNFHIMDSSMPTYAHALGAGGYRPKLVGKLHAIGSDQLLGHVDREVGDHGRMYPGSAPPERGPLAGTAGPERKSITHSGRGASAYQVRDEETAAAVVHELERHATQVRAGMDPGPFALSVGLMLPHPPYIARAEDYDRYDGRVGAPRYPAPPPGEPELYQQWRASADAQELDEADVLQARTAYWACVDRMDRIIGTILDAVRRLGFEDNTLVVYSSDHGDQLGEANLWWKHTLREGSIRVPAILSWPARLPQGVRSEHVVSLLDLTATVLDAANAPALPGSAGRSLLPLLDSGRNGSVQWDDVAYAEGVDLGCLMRSVRHGRWKLVYYHGHSAQLFDLDADPDERVNLAAEPGHADVMTDLHKRLFDGWDPEVVAARLAEKDAQQDVFEAWVTNVQPPQTHRWQMRADMNRLDDAPGEAESAGGVRAGWPDSMVEEADLAPRTRGPSQAGHAMNDLDGI